MSTPRTTVLVEVEDALGPGLDYAWDREQGHIVIAGTRPGGLWLGLDRGFLVDSDDGRGRSMPVLLAVPSSSFAGARIQAQLSGVFSEPSGHVLVARLSGASLPPDPVLRAVGGIDSDAVWLDAGHAADRAAAARRAFRERKGRGRIVGRLAWRPPEGLSAEALAAGGVYSKAERSLDRLPPRFLRGLEGMLDPDERLHYSIERPWLKEHGLLTRVRGGRDQRSGLLLLTDREILWLVDHASPDSYLSDWGVDVELIPLEQLTGVDVEDERDVLQLVFRTPGGRHSIALPVELEPDVRVFEALAARFLPDRNRNRLRRTYETGSVEFVEETAERFGQLAQAHAFQDRARAEAGELLAFVFSPKREGQDQTYALWLSPNEVGLLGPRPVRLALSELQSVGMALSPLTAQITLSGQHAMLTFPYPAPLAVHGAALIRLLRRRWANLPGRTIAGGPAAADLPHQAARAASAAR